MLNPRRLRRYHQKVWLPDNIGELLAKFITAASEKTIGDTYHAKDEQKADKRGKIPHPTRSDLFDPKNTLVECYEILDNRGMRMNKLQKCVIRVTTLSDKYDYTYVIAREGFIVTNWINDKGDDHRLTGNNNYYKPVPQEKLRGDGNNTV